VPAVFSTPGDKKLTIIPTPGPVRVAIEIALVLVALAASAIVWPFWARIPIAVLALVMLTSNARRMAGLASGRTGSVASASAALQTRLDSGLEGIDSPEGEGLG
jgi:hypothetical protein